MNHTEKIIREIKEFHTDIEAWFHGEQDQENLYKKLLSGFDTDFKMTSGDGNTLSLDVLSEWLTGVYGQFPDRSIIIENIAVQTTDVHGLASYIEIQTTGSTVTRRKSSAVFLLNDERALWLHLIEKWI
ncbi:hypothetical protein ACM46_13450 [Chryseobacterium angstadtii]|uniref:DUF4440 domain-containing protein n=1 Tax=Chryseobacterium angstadtii TaxID=558151 RepID=A0A0J7I978_9FLAO|nr:hypothetical protein [Chryseobacterium angstadtii]KMQ62958.1 hypothetical protein ACM46_13450 [Chryseobacterium angstadtii]